MDWHLDPPRRPGHAEKIRLAALTVAALDRMGNAKEDPPPPPPPAPQARTRLKEPWLSVYASTFTTEGAWSQGTRTVVRFYLNAPAHRLIFHGKGVLLPKAAYLRVDPAAHLLHLSWVKGSGHPVTINPNPSGSFSHPFITGELARMAYLLDDGETTYFPLRRGDAGLVADLSTAYSKADAIAHEEDLCARSTADRRPSSRRAS